MIGGKRCVCFDFDGTLADSYEVFVAKFQLLADVYNFKKISREEAQWLRGKSAKEIINYLGIPRYKLPFLGIHLRKEIRKEIPNMLPIAGIKEVLAELLSCGYELGIVSSNSRENVTLFLEQHEMTGFRFLACGSSLYGKARVLSRILKKQGFSVENMLYVGDEIRDIEAAKKVGIPFGAVGWGFNPLERFMAYGPDYIFEKPADIVALLGRCE